MLTAALIFFIYHLAAHLQYAVAGSPQNPSKATCEAGKSVQTTTLVTYGNIPIECPDDTVLQQVKGTKGNETTIFTSDKDSDECVALQKIVPGATCTSSTDKNKLQSRGVLSIVQLPAEPKSVFFVCQKNDKSSQRAERSCVIKVDIPASPTSGPNTCVIPGAQVTFYAPNAETVVQFSCGDLALSPKEKGKAFDGTCKVEVSIESEVPGGVFKSATNGGMVELSFPKQPPQKKTLCYACEKEGQQACNVLIHITGSGAVAITARTASAWGVVLCAVGLIGVY